MEQVSEKDEGVLEFLVDIRSEELYGDEECGFQLTFEFTENEYFENTVLVRIQIANSFNHKVVSCFCTSARVQTKTYHMVDSEEPVLERAVGSKIDWKAGKNVTIKVKFCNAGIWLTDLACKLQV